MIGTNVYDRGFSCFNVVFHTFSFSSREMFYMYPTVTLHFAGNLPPIICFIVWLPYFICLQPGTLSFDLSHSCFIGLPVFVHFPYILVHVSFVIYCFTWCFIWPNRFFVVLISCCCCFFNLIFVIFLNDFVLLFDNFWLIFTLLLHLDSCSSNELMSLSFSCNPSCRTTISRSK